MLPDMRRKSDTQVSKAGSAEPVKSPAGQQGQTGAKPRNLQALFDQLMAEESKRGQMLQIEEEELGFAPDAGGGGNASEAETDEKSEGSDGELCGKDRQDLVADLIGAIDAPAKRGQPNPAAAKSYRAPSKKAKPPKSKPKPTEPVIKVGIPAPRKDVGREHARSIVQAQSFNQSSSKPSAVLTRSFEIKQSEIVKVKPQSHTVSKSPIWCPV